MEGTVWSSKCRTFNCSFPKKTFGKIWNELIRIDLKEKKFSRDLAKERKASNPCKKPSNPCKHTKQTLKWNDNIILLLPEISNSVQ